MFLSPPEIQHQKLKSRLGSYDREDVDELLENIAASYDRVWHERDLARARVTELEKRLDDYQEIERLLRDSLLTGQRAAEEVKSEAARQAEALLEEARRKAERIVGQAHRERDAVSGEIARLRSVEEDVQARCRAVLINALEALGKQDAQSSEARSHPQEAATAKA